MAEVCIWELTRGLSRQFIKTGSTKRLWDNCIELQASIHSRTAYSSYKLDCKVPKVLINGQMDDISNIYKYYWYE